jgi:sugar phosphate isomerase/epimerase
MSSGSIQTVLWEWNVRVHPFEAQLSAAAAGGFDVLTVPYRKFRSELALGRTARDLQRMAADVGVALDFLDGMSGWAPIRYPSGADEFLIAALDFGVDQALDVCAELGLKHIVAIAGFESGALEFAKLVDSFGRFCERAAADDIWVDLESMPMLGLPTLKSTWDIVREANCKNSGLLLDTWHFMQSDPDLTLLGSIPRGRIVNVQIVDGARHPRGGNLWDEAMHFREFPGEGELPLTEILKVLRDTQDLRTVGPEALSDRVDKLPAAEAGAHAAMTTRQAMRSAGFLDC